MKASISLRGAVCHVAVLAALAGLASVQLSAQMLINGAGATFPAPIYQKWFSDFNSVDSNVQINYQAIGSGGGIRQVTEGTVDFGASDGPMTDQQLAEYQQKHGFPVLHFPTVMVSSVKRPVMDSITMLVTRRRSEISMFIRLMLRLSAVSPGSEFARQR